MRICINYLSVVTGGAEIYALNLLKALAKVDSQNEYFVYLPKGKIEDFKVENGNFEFRGKDFTSPYLRILWEQLFLPFELYKNKIDVIFTTGNINVVLAPCKSIVAAHNILPFSAPAMFLSKLKLYYLRDTLKLTSRSIDKIITVSKTAKDELIKYMKISPDKIKTIYHGVSTGEVTKESDCVEEKFDITDNFILSISSVYRSKNYINLIRAFEIYRKRTHTDMCLVIIGKVIERDYYNQMLTEMENLKLKDRVIFIDSLPHNNLYPIYSRAAAYVYPSYIESFGLTPLEAMASGVPVITSNLSAMPEVCGDAAIYFNPSSPEDIAEKIDQVLSNEDLRTKLIDEGLKRAASFSWEKSAKEHLAVFEQVYGAI